MMDGGWDVALKLNWSVGGLSPTFLSYVKPSGSFLDSLQKTGRDQITETINVSFTSDARTNSERSDCSDAVVQMQ